MSGQVQQLVFKLIVTYGPLNEAINIQTALGRKQVPAPALGHPEARFRLLLRPPTRSAVGSAWFSPQGQLDGP